MKIEFDRKALKRFLYWIEERHTIHLKREEGEKRPWTKDNVLRNFFFTNPFRENDKVTVWFRQNLRDPLRDKPEVLLATLIFKWFNWIPTGILLAGDDPHREGSDQELPMPHLSRAKWMKHKKNYIVNWDLEAVVKLLQARAAETPPRKAPGRVMASSNKTTKIFTGAYIIKAYIGMSKIEGVALAVQNLWDDQEFLLELLTEPDPQTGEPCSLERAWKVLCNYPYLGGFMAYEIVSDLRWTYLLDQAPDILTWCNLGPGGKRGINRVLGFPPKKPMPKNWKDIMENLLDITQEHFADQVEEGIMPGFEMREIEHSLCEFDKYERAKFGEGHMKRTYPGGYLR